MPKQSLFKVRKSSIHGTGVFAAQVIRRGTRIIEYFGEKITKKEADIRSNRRRKVYLFTLNSRYDIDGSIRENVARFINHSCEPNCYSEIDRGRVWIYSNRTIQPGEELTYDYGYALDDDWKDYPCLCGSATCIGYIIERRAWKRFRTRILSKDQKTSKSTRSDKLLEPVQV